MVRVEIIRKHKDPLFGRTEIDFVAKEAGSTPSRKELREKICALEDIDEKNMVVGSLKTEYGTSTISGTARVYKDRKEMEKLEFMHIVHRNFGKPEKPKQEGGEKAGKK